MFQNITPPYNFYLFNLHSDIKINLQKSCKSVQRICTQVSWQMLYLSGIIFREQKVENYLIKN